MQIIVDDHTEIKYYRQCLEQINNKYSQNIVVDKCTVIDICDLCIETLVQDFIIFLDRYQNPQDLFQFILLYSNLATEKQRSENTFILMQMCRYVFTCRTSNASQTKKRKIRNTVEHSAGLRIFFSISLCLLCSQQYQVEIHQPGVHGLHD